MQEGGVQSEEIASDVHTLGGRQLVELKNGKVTLKQKTLSFEKQSETLQEIVKFRDFLESRIERRDPPLTEILDEHKPLIAKLAHESDKSLSVLAKQIRQELLPSVDVDTLESSSHVSDALPLSVVEAAIKVILERNNYGLYPSNGGRVPAAISLWRWEVKEAFWDWLPKSGREKAEQRVAERVQAKQDLQLMFNALPQHEQLAILDPKTAKLQSNITNDTKPPDLAASKPASDGKAQTHTKQDDDTLATQIKSGRPKKIPESARLAKDKEKLEKKVAKAEKEKKERDAQDKSRSIMANFFSKRAPATKSTIFHSMNAKAGPSDAQSDFSKAFKPFVIKKGVQLASINHFLKSKSNGKSVARNINREVITIDVIDDSAEDVVMADPRPPLPDVSTMSTKERLRSLLSDLPVPVSLDASRVCPPYNAFCKTHSSSSIRAVVSQLTEAELAGDDGLVRALLAKLRDRTIFPAKVFIFHEDARPGYFGTLTRSSKVISARTPYAKDLIGIDYGYDSGEEWEDEGTMDADDVVDDDDDDPQDEEADSDWDSWLVDDDHVDANDPDSIPPDIPELSFNPPKRRIETEDKSGKRRKVVIPLVPFAKGPCWESAIGYCEYGPFKAYRIRLLNDTPFPIDPFKFISSDPEEQGPVQKNRNLDNVHVGPVGIAIPKRLTVAPKNAFPDTYLPFLLTKITTLQAGSITFLVEAIYQELRGNKVKKNAIEAKVREVAEKCKESRIWVIKSAFKSDAPS
ncbi:hypothetical protein APHAL10511_007049 [Amanita phalloides]|nr:hypothetical protein APHAL10511_007049 [Amanita phalloides]